MKACLSLLLLLPLLSHGDPQPNGVTPAPEPTPEPEPMGHHYPPYGNYPPTNYHYPKPEHHYPDPGHHYPEPGHQYPKPGHQYPKPGHQYPKPGHHYPKPGHHYSKPGYHYHKPGHHYSKPGHHYPEHGYHYPMGHHYPMYPYKPHYPKLKKLTIRVHGSHHMLDYDSDMYKQRVDMILLTKGYKIMHDVKADKKKHEIDIYLRDDHKHHHPYHHDYHYYHHHPYHWGNHYKNMKKFVLSIYGAKQIYEVKPNKKLNCIEIIVYTYGKQCYYDIKSYKQSHLIKIYLQDKEGHYHQDYYYPGPYYHWPDNGYYDYHYKKRTNEGGIIDDSASMPKDGIDQMPGEYDPFAIGEFPELQ